MENSRKAMACSVVNRDHRRRCAVTGAIVCSCARVNELMAIPQAPSRNPDRSRVDSDADITYRTDPSRPTAAASGNSRWVVMDLGRQIRQKLAVRAPTPANPIDRVPNEPVMLSKLSATRGP